MSNEELLKRLKEIADLADYLKSGPARSWPQCVIELDNLILDVSAADAKDEIARIREAQACK